MQPPLLRCLRSPLCYSSRATCPYSRPVYSPLLQVASGRRTGGEALPLVLLAPRVLGPWGGASILGLGDVVLPGLLVVFTKRFDLHAKRQGTAGYFLWTITGYGVGEASSPCHRLLAGTPGS